MQNLLKTLGCYNRCPDLFIHAPTNLPLSRVDRDLQCCFCSGRRAVAATAVIAQNVLECLAARDRAASGSNYSGRIPENTMGWQVADAGGGIRGRVFLGGTLGAR